MLIEPAVMKPAVRVASGSYERMRLPPMREAESSVGALSKVNWKLVIMMPDSAVDSLAKKF